MIDWLTLRVHCECPVEVGKVICVDADGQVEWQSARRWNMEGSHSSTVQVRRAGLPIRKGRNDPLTCLEISGNPAKFFQGHNLFGSDDLSGLSLAFVRAVVDRVGYELSEFEQRLLADGHIFLNRVDATESWSFGTLPRAMSVVRALSDAGRFSYLGRGAMTDPGTVYWKKRSRHVSGKAYAKGNELKVHKLPAAIEFRDELMDYAEGLVRFEFTHRKMALERRKLHIVRNWNSLGVTPTSLHAEHMEGLTISDHEIPGDELERVPQKLRLVYTAWKAGTDMKASLSRPTFYRYRRQLLPFGVDLAAMQPSKRDPSNVIPLRVTLVGKPATVPSWAIGTALYFDPPKLVA